MSTSAIILSAGKGTRMHTDISKQYLCVQGYPILYYTLKAFEQSKVDEIILVVGKDDLTYVKEEIIDKYHIDKVTDIVVGGKERYDSVQSGLEAVHYDYVLVHDGARPLIKTEHINIIIEEVEKGNSCIAGMPVKDTIKISDDAGYVVTTPLRKNTWQVQTPQGFSTAMLKEAYKEMKKQGDITITDDGMVVEKYGRGQLKLMQTDYSNIKITTREDLLFVESYLSNQAD